MSPASTWYEIGGKKGLDTGAEVEIVWSCSPQSRIPQKLKVNVRSTCLQRRPVGVVHSLSEVVLRNAGSRTQIEMYVASLIDSNRRCKQSYYRLGYPM
jgi:hypothetical protein